MLRQMEETMAYADSENRPIAGSELIINDDGSVFHIHMRPEELADNVILVGDPGRVDMVAGHLTEQEFRHQSPENMPECV